MPDNDDHYPHEQLPGTDMMDWLRIKKREATTILEGMPLVEGEVVIRINGKNRSGQQVRDGQLVDIPIDEAMTILNTKLLQAKDGGV